jgi:NAD(P)-dependent dehydrogenase (short-subunit alcohol dehydrogenase family)
VERRVDLQSRNVLITGSNRGVGAALVRAALDRQAATIYAGTRTVAAGDRYDPPAAGRIVPLRLDVMDTADIDAAAADCQDVDLLVINAGVTCIMPAIAAPDETRFRETMEVNFFGTLHLLRAFAPVLKARRGGVGGRRDAVPQRSPVQREQGRRPHARSRRP